MRSIKSLHIAYRDDIADLTTRRPIPGSALDQIDPFLFLNHHGPQTYMPGNHGLPFGPHPHRGFETVTFIIEGSLAHSDTGGHESIIEKGGVQWMTAGSGLIHSELSPVSFKRDGGPIEILQLWINLPSRLKMTAPRYQGVQKDQIPEIPIADHTGQLNLVSGTFEGQTGPIESLTGIFMSTVTLKAGACCTLLAPAGRSVFLYVVHGVISVGGKTIEKWHLVQMDDDGETITVNVQNDTLLLFGHADPIAEPVVARGPFVMNTEEEIRQAMDDYKAGVF